MAQDIPQAWIDKVKDLASGEVFTAEAQGKWEGKAGSHVPVASKEGDGSITVKVGLRLLKATFYAIGTVALLHSAMLQPNASCSLTAIPC